jgi:ABC-type phosphate transport system ATPase subunit
MTAKPIAKKAARSDHPSGEESSKARWDEVSVSTLIPKMRTEGLRAYFGQAEVLKGISLPIAEKQVTAVIGPSGCGKSTFVRCLNRMHEVVPGAHASGRVLLDTQDIYQQDVDPVRVRRRVGMVFQKPNPFPTMSIRDNVLAGLRLNGERPDDPDAVVEKMLHRVALWVEPAPGSPVVSNNACASRVRWRSSRKCC